MYVWNGFTIVGKRADLTENILATLDRAEEELKYNSSEEEEESGGEERALFFHEM